MNDMNEMIDNGKSIFPDSTTTQSPADTLKTVVIPLEGTPLTINQHDAVHAQHIQDKPDKDHNDESGSSPPPVFNCGDNNAAGRDPNQPVRFSDVSFPPREPITKGFPLAKKLMYVHSAEGAEENPSLLYTSSGAS